MGGGPTGVETTGALAELMRALHETGRLDEPGRITLVDRGDALLGQFSDKAHEYALDKLTEAGAEIRLGVGVTAVHAGPGRARRRQAIATRTVVWGGGESGRSGCAGRRARRRTWWPDRRRYRTSPCPGYPGRLRGRGRGQHPRGDDPARPLPAARVGGPAVRQVGRDRTSLRELRGEPTEPFHYKDKGIMAMIGRNAAVAEVGKRRHEVEGPLAFAAWLGVHAMLLSGVHSKTDAFLDWAWDYFDRDHAATVEASTSPRPPGLGRPRRGRAAHRAGPTRATGTTSTATA